MGNEEKEKYPKGQIERTDTTIGPIDVFINACFVVGETEM